MLSLKKSMDLYGDTQSKARTSLDTIRRVLSALERAAEILAEEESLLFREELISVRHQLEGDADPQVIEESGEQVEKGLNGFAHGVAKVRDRKEQEYKQIIRIVAEAGVTMAKGGSSQSEELTQFAAKIDTVSRLASIAEIRKELAGRVSELKLMATRIHADGQAKAQALENEIRNVHEKLKVAETLAETDALTGLGNRRMAESAMQAAIDSGRAFSLLVFDLNGFKAINDRHGHLQGDQLLKAVAQQMKACVRESDTVCRWGGDEFVVLMRDTPLAIAEERAVRIQNNACGQFILGDGEKSVRVNIGSSVGIAQYRLGESANDFFRRADKIMYERKAQRKAAAPQYAPAR